MQSTSFLQPNHQIPSLLLFILLHISSLPVPSIHPLIIPHSHSKPVVDMCSYQHHSNYLGSDKSELVKRKYTVIEMLRFHENIDE